MLAFTYYPVTDVARARKFSRFGFFYEKSPTGMSCVNKVVGAIVRTF